MRVGGGRRRVQLHGGEAEPAVERDRRSRRRTASGRRARRPGGGTGCRWDEQVVVALGVAPGPHLPADDEPAHTSRASPTTATTTASQVAMNHANAVSTATASRPADHRSRRRSVASRGETRTQAPRAGRTARPDGAGRRTYPDATGRTEAVAGARRLADSPVVSRAADARGTRADRRVRRGRRLRVRGRPARVGARRPPAGDPGHGAQHRPAAPGDPRRAAAAAGRSTASGSCRAEPIVGYMHRGAEKLFEVRDYRQIIVLANRHDWLSAFANELGVVLAVERMLGMEVPVARGLGPHAARRAEPGAQPPDVPRLLPARARRDHADLLRVPRARGRCRR